MYHRGVVIVLLQGEKIEGLSKNISVIVSPQHTFGTDATLLANFAAPKKKDRACDMGTGCGIIPLIWCRKETPASITALDIQEKACAQLKRSVEMNRLEERISVVNCDLRRLKGVLPFGAFDLVTMNPPYKAVRAGLESMDEAQRIARHEVACTVYDAANAASMLLNYGGRFCICHRPERLTDVLDAMRKANLEPKRLRFVCQREGEAPWLLLAEGKKGGKPNITILPALIVEDKHGNYTPEMEKIYGEYREMRE